MNMRVLVLTLVVFLSGLPTGFAAKKGVCPDLVGYSATVEPDTLGGPGGKPRRGRTINLQTNAPHGQIEQSGYSGSYSPSARFGDERIQSDYGPHFDEGTGYSGPLF